MQSGLNGKYILLTGATGSIGRVTARFLTEQGALVILNGRDLKKLEAVAERLPPDSCFCESFDLDQAESIPAWVKALSEKYGPLRGIAHTAGIQETRPLRVISAEFINKFMQTNVTTALMFGKAFRQKGCHADGASLVLVASTAAFIGGAGNSAYAASKGAVMAASKAMAHELLRDKIRVNCVVPGLIESDMAAKARQTTPPDSWNVVLSGYPMGIGTPEDVANGIVHLLSDRSRWMTGSELQLDGGLAIV